MRKDAVHNRERLLKAARELFADRGLDVPLEEVARRAGVSIGTLYNRFPTRDDLVEAVFADRVAAVRELAERALAEDDAWQGFVDFLTGVCELQSVDLGCNELAVRIAGAGAGGWGPEAESGSAVQTGEPAEAIQVGEPVGAVQAERSGTDEGRALMRRLVARAQQAGVLRPDLTLEDLAFVIWGVAGTVRATFRTAPGAWRRHLALSLDGLRADAARPLPVPPMTTAQTREALGGCGSQE
ncbi:helix-turn-helix domain containing protein [Nonomuraea sp. MCN248]|uniref:Helix-turn-helix domain containing protein n=1 Tax=Nonomuraea corallina TaxID=2989783 RepID=A0ABT4SJN7_9ACTN|nr:helix-turn-helix domain-containing protein [Nonomuraea corallina]MDA0637442.1 helix-turn-helix domain containing protein [Nonomuraea corallina]